MLAVIGATGLFAAVLEKFKKLNIAVAYAFG